MGLEKPKSVISGIRGSEAVTKEVGDDVLKM